MKIKDLALGDLFTLKHLEEPKDCQIWIRKHYDRSSKTYCAINWDDISRERFFKGDKEVYEV